MNRLQGMYPLERSTPSLLREEPLLGRSPALAGSLFVLGADGGYGAAPGVANRLRLGRNSPDVHVTVGAGDCYVSREHATLQYKEHGSGTSWTLRNDGRLPIRMADTPALLREHEAALPPGYTPLFIRGARLHVVELLVSSGGRVPGRGRPDTDTRSLELWPLTPREKLVLVVMFQGVLRRDDHPHPLSWNDTGHALNDVPGQHGWTGRKAENVVDGVRRSMVAAGATGITADTAPTDVIKLNLQRLLLDSATLVPPDLRLLDNGIGDGVGRGRHGG